jgi:hypothetical protein
MHPPNRGNSWPATATLVVHVEPKRIPLETGGDRFSAWLVIKAIGVKKTIGVKGGWPRVDTEGLIGSD